MILFSNIHFMQVMVLKSNNSCMITTELMDNFFPPKYLFQIN